MQAIRIMYTQMDEQHNITAFLAVSLTFAF